MLPNLFLMVGEDHFSLLQEVRRWKSAFLEKWGDTDLEELDGETARFDQIAASLSTIPFLSKKRLVVIKAYFSSRKAEDAEKILPILEKIPETTIVLLVEGDGVDKRTRAFKLLSILAQNRLFLKPKGVQLTTWVQRRAEFHEGHMEGQTASTLVSFVGDNLFSLDQEIQKLCLLAQGKPITQRMVEDVVTSTVQKSIFTLTDQLARKDFRGALFTLYQLQEQGEEAGFIFSMLCRQFRLLLEMKALAEENFTPTMIARKMNVHPYVVNNTVHFVKNFTQTELRKLLAIFLNIDTRLKTGLLQVKPREEDHFFLVIEKALLG